MNIRSTRSSGSTRLRYPIFSGITCGKGTNITEEIVSSGWCPRGLLKAIVAGVDSGILSVRVSIVDSERGMLGSAITEYPLHRKREDPEYATQSHEDHMQALAAALALGTELNRRRQSFQGWIAIQMSFLHQHLRRYRFGLQFARHCNRLH